jgi:hypothetical protein
MRSLLVNPCRENPRRKRRRRAKRANPFENPRKRRRGRRGRSFRFAGAKRLDFKDLLMSAAFVSGGAILARLLPERVFKIGPESGRTKRALAAIGTGGAIAFIGSKYIGARNAQMLAIGGISTGLNMLVEEKLPAGMRVSGLYGPEELSDAQLDAELRKLSAGEVSADWSLEEETAGIGDDELEGAGIVGDTYETTAMPGSYLG